MIDSKEKILKVLRDNKEQLKSKYPIQSIGLFGSYARNENNSNSDIDIIIKFNDTIGIEFIDLADEIESILQNRVDLVSANGIKEKYILEIKKDIIYA